MMRLNNKQEAVSSFYGMMTSKSAWINDKQDMPRIFQAIGIVSFIKVGQG